MPDSLPLGKPTDCAGNHLLVSDASNGAPENLRLVSAAGQAQNKGCYEERITEGKLERLDLSRRKGIALEQFLVRP